MFFEICRECSLTQKNTIKIKILILRDLITEKSRPPSEINRSHVERASNRQPSSRSRHSYSGCPTFKNILIYYYENIQNHYILFLNHFLEKSQFSKLSTKNDLI